ncbi:MAG: DsbA family oxidoreductase [Alphaproteobacteria bacterium]|nr:DsbA family oxidoreductase [Alphaproteobacteria bacterium]
MRTIGIDIFSDVICPWCYVGKRRLERALAARTDVPAVVRWRAFLLNPDMPPEGMDRRAYIERKFGSAVRARDLYAAIEEVGGLEGIDFAFDRIRRTPSTVKAHRIIGHAEPGAPQDALVESLFRAYFTDGRDIGDDAVLLEVAGDAGLNPATVSAALDGDEGDRAVRGDNALAHAMGIGGVPCFIVDGRYAIAGAQEPEVMQRLIEGVAAMTGATPA